MESIPMMVLSSTDTEVSAQKLAKQVIEKGLAACVQIVPGVTSYYKWQGQIESNTEYLLYFKTLSVHSARLYKEIKSIHHYDTPEIMSVDITGIDEKYQEWLRASTGQYVS